MNEWLAPGAILALIGTLVTWAGVSFTRRNSQDTLLLASRDDHIDDLREDLAATRKELKELRDDVQRQGQQIYELQVQEWGLRRYVHRLLDFIRGFGEEPPPPPTDLNL